VAPDDWRRNAPRFQGENFQKNLDLVGRIEEMARDKRYKPSHLALAWIRTLREDMLPIPRTTRIEQLEENLAASETKLTSDDLAQINEVASEGVATGDW
jgi:aryl-alcohol dehydrogenase-like predicted oxidoreductase